MSSPARLGLLILAVPDFLAALRFYQAAFGWPLIVDALFYAELQLPGGMRLGIYQRENFGKNTGETPHLVPKGALSPTELYFYVDDPAAALEKVVEAGGRLLSPLAPRDWGDEAAYAADPAGNVVVLARPSAPKSA